VKEVIQVQPEKKKLTKEEKSVTQTSGW